MKNKLNKLGISNIFAYFEIFKIMVFKLVFKIILFFMKISKFPFLKNDPFFSNISSNISFILHEQYLYFLVDKIFIKINI